MLGERPTVSPRWAARLEKLIGRTSRTPPFDLPAIIRDELGVDVGARYAGAPIAHPFGKASGQLSFTPQQVETDLAAGMGFVVLKTAIAEDASGARSMEDWSTSETRMHVEERRSTSGKVGWTVTWTGRGWSGSLDDYAEFLKQTLRLPNDTGIPIIPSVKYNLPIRRSSVLEGEYRHTTARLLDVWRQYGPDGPLVVEKDFSPTLAGADRSSDRGRILEWIANVPAWVAATSPHEVRVGLKLMNALFDDDFQVEMVRVASEAGAAFLVTFNRLFDRQSGVAYGGWDLSDRNLRILDALNVQAIDTPPLSATGNICSGRIMVEYARRGCENGQVHTFFQIPQSHYLATGGSRVSRALHTLLLHPRDGLVVWLRDRHEAGDLEPRDGNIHFMDLVTRRARV